ncbi:MAG: hypothetical protein WBC04_22830 [Candidatus Acidiferrales bacterium]
MKRIALLCLAFILAFPWAAGAQAQKSAKDDKEERLKDLEEQVRLLQADVQTLMAARAAQVVQASAVAPAAHVGVLASPAPASNSPLAQQAPETGGAQSQLPVYGGASSMAKVLNPDISVIGDFLGAAGSSNVPPALKAAGRGPLPAFELHESEVGLQAIVDPYARADFFLSFGESGVSVEEGYITFTSLPAGFVAKVGKMRSAFGKVNTLHNHVLPWTDRPLMTENLVGGEDGIDDAGLSVTRILPAPKGIFLEGTAQAFRGDSGDVFKTSQRSDVSVVGHLRAYRDLTESSNIDLGFSYARGHNDLGSTFLTDLYGIDATFHWTPLRRTIYHNFVGRAEFVWSRRDQLPIQQRASGFYTSGDYRLSRRWTVGGRYDRSGRARAANLTDNGFSALLTYWPSEFSQIRGQYRFMRYAEGLNANELLFQFQFSLGAHGAHPF